MLQQFSRWQINAMPYWYYTGKYMLLSHNNHPSAEVPLVLLDPLKL